MYFFYKHKWKRTRADTKYRGFGYPTDTLFLFMTLEHFRIYNNDSPDTASTFCTVVSYRFHCKFGNQSSQEILVVT